MEKRKCDTDREYTVWELIKQNLTVWRLIVFFALAGAIFLGGYKYWCNRAFVSEKKYKDICQVMASFYVEEYSGESAPERAGTVIKVADSRNAYETFKKISGYELEYLGYQALFDLQEGGDSDVITLYVKYPGAYKEFTLDNEQEALEFAGYLMRSIEDVMEDAVGKKGVRVLDQPYVADKEQRLLAYAPTRREFWQEITKAAVAGAFFGIIVEVAFFAALAPNGRREQNKEG